MDDTRTTAIRGNLAPQLADAADIGPADRQLPLERMILTLTLRPGAQERLDALLRDQLDPTSPRFHQWLTPEEFGREFGISNEDLKAVVDWLQRSGLGVDEVAAGRGWIYFSGTLEQVERAFRTEFRQLLVSGRPHIAARVEPQVPQGIADLVIGIPTLGDFFAKPQSRASLTTLSTGAHALSPGDFATIYNTAPLITTRLDGTGQTIAVVGRTDINLSDVRNFRTAFGLPINDPVVTHTGPAPGIVSDDEGEACLDVEWSGAVAPNATINFVVSKNTATSDGVALSAQYAVNGNIAPIITVSFGICEDQMSSTSIAALNSLLSQAASQGITVFVASGDSGASTCEGASSSTGSGRAVNGFASTPYNVSVGGTQFMDTGNPALYWNSSNSQNGSSAKSYIPEQAWNESGNIPGGGGLWSTGGGASRVHSKPSWQSAPGVPNDGARDLPDVSLTAAAHDGYIVFKEFNPSTGSFYVFSGTSASAPSFAGIMALVLQKTGGRQGNPNPTFYRLAQAQYGGGGAAVFHDTTVGNNSVPGVPGFSAGPGYDLATGLGSVDANALVNNFSGTPAPVASFTYSANPKSGTPVQFNDASTGSPTSWSWNFGDSGTSTSQNPTHTYAAAGAYQVSLTVSNAGGSNNATQSINVGANGATTCTPDALTMCMVNGRYRVTSHWKNQYAGGATANLNKSALTDTTGAFWLFNAATLEYMVRFNTATDNGKVWVAIPMFTQVEFWIDVLDTKTGLFKEYHSAPGNQTLLYDPSYFPFP